MEHPKRYSNSITNSLGEFCFLSRAFKSSYILIGSPSVSQSIATNDVSVRYPYEDH